MAFEALEPEGRRILREQLQIELLREIKPDICFFQEVNPLAKRAPLLAQAIDMSSVSQSDLVGLKLFGFGLPFNLNSGLVIQVKRSVGLKKIAGVSLSRPGSNLVQSWASWQLKEERFALFAETLLPGWGRVLLINTHLHHGLEATPQFIAALEALASELDLAPNIVTEIQSRMHRGSERRAEEIGVLIAELEKYEQRYEVVILGGDFNASPESDFGQALRAKGFRDTWREVHPSSDLGLTFDSTRNSANHLLQDRFPLTLVVEDLSFASKTKEALLALVRSQESRPRRIDYLWLRADSVEMQIQESRLVGLPNAEGLAPSDHFGVCADIARV